MIVKEQQPTRYAAMALLFELPPAWDPTEHAAGSTVLEQGHGRLETRMLARRAGVHGYLAGSGMGQVLRRSCERSTLKTGQVRREVPSGGTGLAPQVASAEQSAAWWRGHWTIEGACRPGVTRGEDASQGRQGRAPHALAA